jgi:hypothetical protein
MYNLDSFPERLTYLVRNRKVFDVVYASIRALAVPLEILRITSLFAKSVKVFDLRIRHGWPSMVSIKAGTGRAFATAVTTATTTTTTTTTPAAAPAAAAKATGIMMDTKYLQSTQKSKRRQAFEAPDTVPEKANNGISDTAMEFLLESDRQCGLAHLDATKKNALGLIEAVLHGKIPEPKENAYLLCGFAACRSAKEKAELRQIYSAYLLGRINKTKGFQALCHALEADTLLSLLEESREIREAICGLPGASLFLRISNKRKPTVWRLIQFLDDTATEPPAYLRRDYGFQLCKTREEVQVLKDIYSDILDLCGPLELHEACTQRQLLEFARSKGVPVLPRYQRLMQNTVHPDLGYETQTGPKGYEHPLFKRKI